MAEVPNATNAPNTRKSRKSPRDFTGKQDEDLKVANEVELNEAAEKMSLATAKAAKEQEQVIDYTGADTPVEEVETQEVEVNEPERFIRVNSEIEDMVFGRQVVTPASADEHGNYRPAVLGPLNFFNFSPGKRYKVPRELAEHLSKLGYLYE